VYARSEVRVWNPWAVLAWLRVPRALSRQRAEMGIRRPVDLRNALANRTALWAPPSEKQWTRKLEERWEERMVRMAGMRECCFVVEERQRRSLREVVMTMMGEDGKSLA
jgi:hypothetical protein